MCSWEMHGTLLENSAKPNYNQVWQKLFHTAQTYFKKFSSAELCWGYGFFYVENRRTTCNVEMNFFWTFFFTFILKFFFDVFARFFGRFFEFFGRFWRFSWAYFLTFFRHFFEIFGMVVFGRFLPSNV